MKSAISHFASIGLIAGGLVLAGAGLTSLRETNEIHHSRNPFAIQKSAYGKLLARLSETTVDRIWHLGVEQVAPHSHGHDGHDCDEHGCKDPAHDHSHDSAADPHDDHDHAGHNHDHSSHDQGEPDGEEEAFVFHVTKENLEEEDHDPETCTSPYCNHDHGKKEEEHLSFIDRSKKYLHEFNQIKFMRTNPRSMNEAHLAWAKKEVEKQLLHSYKMDPLHYGAYNSYHLFLTVHEFGGTEATRERAKLIAQITMQEALKENEDPEPYVTAAAAMLNLFFLENGTHMENGTKMPVEDLKRFRNDIQHCLGRFKELYEAALENGVWDNLSRDRQLEIASRIRFSNRTFEQFDVMIARAESNRDKTVDEEVAEILDFEKE